MNSKPIVVIGGGWAGLGAAGFLASSGVQVVWITGTGARIVSPIAGLPLGPGCQVWQELGAKLGIELGEAQVGSYIREFRNKSFRKPSWTKAPSLEARQEIINEELWAPERRWLGTVDTRFSLSLSEIEEEFRKILTPQNFLNLRKIEGVPVQSFKKENHAIVSVVLASGIEIPCEQVIYADRWSTLSVIEGVPKPLSFLRKRDPVAILQANFGHSPPIAQNISESFFAALHRETGETLERHIWGYFTSSGERSTWSLCLTQEEVENNHEIGKKLRRLKSTLDKIFSGSGWVSPEKGGFSATLCEEQYLFVEEMIFSEGKPLEEPILLPEISGLLLMTDGYGPYSALQQVGAALGLDLKNPDLQTENLNHDASI